MIFMVKNERVSSPKNEKVLSFQIHKTFYSSSKHILRYF